MRKIIDTTHYLEPLDGLRAYAVIAVLLFHAFPEYFPGGFIGVDVFFVISGFIISRTYLDRLISGEVSLKHFYVKRIRRLAPAYFLVLAISALFALIVLPPDLLLEYAKAFIAQAAYLQNFVFWIQGDYFNGPHTKPLLHTWSLAIEEQFYLLFGLLVLFFRRRWLPVLGTIFAVAALSLLVGFLLQTLSPKTAFYLLPTRIWQFAIGIMAYMVTKLAFRSENRGYSVLLTLISVGTLLWCVVGFGGADPFPGPHALLAGAASALLLYLIQAHPVQIHNWFAVKPLQHTGNISYSLYLWHWPILSFAAVVQGRLLNPGEAILALCLAYICADFSTRWLERPIRNGGVFSSPKSATGAFAISSIIVVIVGGFFYLSNGAVYRYPLEERTLLLASMEKSPVRCSYFKRLQFFNHEVCRIGERFKSNNGVLIIGDSHADQLDEMIAEIANQNAMSAYLAIRACDLDDFGKTRYCTDSVLDSIISDIEKFQIKTIIATSFWKASNLDKENLAQVVDKLLQSDVSLFISRTVPYGPFFHPERRLEQIRKNISVENMRFPLDTYTKVTKEQNTFFSELETNYPDKVSILHPSLYLCSQPNYCDFATNGLPNYFDDSHLTRTGVRQLEPMYEAVIENIPVTTQH